MKALKGKIVVVYCLLLLLLGSCCDSMQLALIEEQFGVAFDEVTIDSLSTKEQWNELGLTDGVKCVSIYTSTEDVLKIYQSISQKEEMKRGVLQDLLFDEYVHPSYGNTEVFYCVKQPQKDETCYLILDIEHGIIYYYLIMI
ncbi:MAG: hypothetical protein J6Y37_07790 [Paludibacteraceae bacterium]|nr:hypothetical protein [Paludibacteraceae bacterium]